MKLTGLIRHVMWFAEMSLQPRPAHGVPQVVTAVGISAMDTAERPLREELMSTLELPTAPDLAVGEL